MLVAFNKADFGWVRGRVVTVRRDGGVVVKLVDLETTELVTELNRLRQIPSELREVPSPLVIVKLSVLPADDDLDEDTMEALFDECLQNLPDEILLRVQVSLCVRDDVAVVRGHLVTRDMRAAYNYLVEEQLVNLY